MKAILINPFEMTVTEVEYSGDYKQIYSLIDCECFDVARINREGDGIYIDDEGLIREKAQEFFAYQDYPNPLAGYGLVLGVDEEGESVSPSVTLDEVKRKVTWVMPLGQFQEEIVWGVRE